MSNVINILRDQYNAVINQEKNWDFFSTLAGYINYILETPVFKKITDGVMNKKQKEYDKLAELEEKSLQELGQAKKKLLKIIKDNNILPNSLISRLPAIPQQEGFDNILDKLEAFEEGKRLSISGFKSDNLESFLFDIAASILKQGYQSPLKEFLVSNEEYGNYHYEPDSGLIITGNENGNFIFSKTLRLRREQSGFIEKTEKFELWGAFNALLKFQKAFFEKSQNKSSDYIYQKHSEGARNSQEESDVVDIVFFAQDLATIIESGLYKSMNPDIRYLRKDDFKNYILRVHSYLMQELAKAENQKDALKELKIKEKVIIDLQRGIYNAAHPNRIYEISGKRLGIVNYLSKNNTASLSDLSACTGQVNSLIVKEIKEVNSNFRTNLKIKTNLIVHSKTGGGYRLNRDDLDIKTPT